MDLAVTSYLLAIVAAVVFRLGKTLGAKYPVHGQQWLVGGIVLAVWLAWHSGNNFRWALLVPHGCVLLLANASVILVVGSAGLLTGTKCLSYPPAPAGGRRESFAAIALCFTAAWFVMAAVVRPVLRPIALNAESKWRNGVCMQSHEASCAPAAAATLLRNHGIICSEADLAGACLTSSRGTLALGTFRGLCFGSRNSRFAPRALVFDPQSIPSADIEQHLPMLVHVDFNPSTHAQFFGGSLLRREGHTIVLLGLEDDGSWIVADPACGRARWTDQRLRNRCVGEGIFLFEQSATAS